MDYACLLCLQKKNKLANELCSKCFESFSPVPYTDSNKFVNDFSDLGATVPSPPSPPLPENRSRTYWNPYKQPRIVSLYLYSDKVRTIILKAKVRNDFLCLIKITELFCINTKIRELAEWAEKIMPAPSSLWSRLNGKTDIAWVLADALARKHHLKMQSPPFALSFKLKKQAKTLNRQKIVIKREKDVEHKKIRLLIIDDVITSGQTFQRLANHLDNKYEIRFATFSTAQRQNRTLKLR